jgi:hypothetical protein
MNMVFAKREEFAVRTLGAALAAVICVSLSSGPASAAEKITYLTGKKSLQGRIALQTQHILVG